MNLIIKQIGVTSLDRQTSFDSDIYIRRKKAPTNFTAIIYNIIK